MKVSVCILTYNRAKILKELLGSLGKISYSPLEVIVIDNHSSDGTASMIREQFPEIRYFKTSKNIGVAARNVGLSKANGDIVITLDDDVIGIDDKDIATLIGLFESKPDVGAICFKIIDSHTGKVGNWCHHYNKDEFSDKEFITDEITEGAVVFRKSALDRSGLYPSYFFISYEGADLLCRMLDAGYKTIYSPEVCVSHHTAQEGRKNWRRYYYDTRNQIWFVVRNYPVSWGAKYLFRGLLAMLFYSTRDGFFYYWAKGLWDGFRGLPGVLRDRKPISRKTRRILTEISAHRPNLFYMITQRVFKKEIRL